MNFMIVSEVCSVYQHTCNHFAISSWFLETEELFPIREMNKKVKSQWKLWSFRVKTCSHGINFDEEMYRGFIDNSFYKEGKKIFDYGTTLPWAQKNLDKNHIPPVEVPGIFSEFKSL